MGFYKNTSGVLTPIAGGVSNSNAPIGAIFPFGGTSAPSGYLLCNGQAVSRTDYSALFAVIGTSFGAGDGSTTFNIPDLREATTKGVGLSGKSSNHYDSDGVALGEFVDDRNKSHTHDMSNHTHSGTTNGMNRNAEHNHRILTIGSTQAGATYVSGTSDGGSLIYTTTEVANTDHEHTFTTGAPGNNITGSSGSATNEVKAVGVNYIIKAKDVNLSGGGQALADRVETLENEYNNVLEKVALFDLKPTTAQFPLNESTTFDNLLDTFKTFHSLYPYNNRIFEIGVYSEAEDSSTTYALARNGHPTYVGKANELYDMYPGNDIKYTAEFELQSTLAVIKISAYNATTNKFSYTYVNYRPTEPNQLRIEVSDNNSVSVEANIASQAELSDILAQAVPAWNASGFVWGAFEITGPII